MLGFKDFILRGNLVELAVAFVMATAFAAVVTATVTVIMDLIGKVVGRPDFSGYVPGGVHVGAWLTALVSFFVLAAVVYFLIVTPYQKARDALNRDEPADAVPTALSEDTTLLSEIRDLLRARNDSV